MSKLASIVCLCTIGLLLGQQPRLAGCWFFAPGPPAQAPAEHQEPGRAARQEQAASPTNQDAGNQQLLGPDDDLLFLSDDEVVHNRKVLKSLKHADPREIEELIDSNPILEEMVLKKIQAKLERESRRPKAQKAEAKPVQPAVKKVVYSYPIDHPSQQQQHQQQEEPDEESDDYGGDEEVVDKKKYDSLKAKLKSNAAKIFKMGSGFKAKYAALRNKYKVKTVTKDVELPPPPPPPEQPTKIKVVEKDKEKVKVPKLHFVSSYS